MGMGLSMELEGERERESEQGWNGKRTQMNGTGTEWIN